MKRDNRTLNKIKNPADYSRIFRRGGKIRTCGLPDLKSGRDNFVGAARFELATSCSQSRRDNRATLRPVQHYPNGVQMYTIFGNNNPAYTIAGDFYCLPCTRLKCCL